MSSFSDRRLLEINFLDIGQGDGCHVVTPDDKIMLIDAGEGDHMCRFLNWRYNLRRRHVDGADPIVEGEEHVEDPVHLDHVVISHPDKDHYYGFKCIFEQSDVKPLKVYHNSLVERPIKGQDKDPSLKYYSHDDLGGYVETDDEEKYVWDVIGTNEQMHTLIEQHATTRKLYLGTLRAAKENNPRLSLLP